MPVFRYYQKIESKGTFWLWDRGQPPVEGEQTEVGWGVIEQEMREGVICIPTLGMVG